MANKGSGEEVTSLKHLPITNPFPFKAKNSLSPQRYLNLVQMLHRNILKCTRFQETVNYV